jgi:thiamine biosynthesis protein ThiI
MVMEQSILVRFSEITLKGKNRYRFEDRMARNIGLHLKPYGKFRMSRGSARMTVAGEGDLALAASILQRLPGVANISLTHPADREPERLAEAAVAFMQAILAEAKPRKGRPLAFRIEAQRKDKAYPMRSMELAALLGRRVLDHFPHLVVDLTEPDIVVNVEVWPDSVLLFSEKLEGPGGLPVGSSGKALCLQSAGIDSPVAAHLMMTRGVSVVHLNFHGYPFIGEQSKEKVHQAVRFLARHQPHSRLYVAPFGEIQQQIRDKCPERLRTLLYRRTMNRVANVVARREHCLALITGESVGQVASQTLRNLRVIHDTAELPVLQPLIGLSKQEIVRRAQRIGTYSISIQPFADCCTLFQPRHPETGAALEVLRHAEQALPMQELVDACVSRLEITDYGPEYYPATWE